MTSTAATTSTDRDQVEASGRQAAPHRMVMKDHICPYGLKAKDLLRRRGFEIEDHPLTSQAETEAFKAKHDVETTPQVFIEGKRIGGYDELRKYFGLEVADEDATSYQPIIAVFSTTLLMALAGNWAAFHELLSLRTLAWFVAMSMCVLAILKLRDLEGFSTQFLGYDLLAQRYVPYAYFYAFAEGLAGVLMIAGTGLWLAIPLALLIGSVGAVSVFKAVYIDKRELKCACVGGSSNVPLGFVSLTENLMMVGMAVWMLVR
jgi:glutaredoxin